MKSASFELESYHQVRCNSQGSSQRTPSVQGHEAELVGVMASGTALGSFTPTLKSDEKLSAFNLGPERGF